MATSWQYNTSANMSSYGSVAAIPNLSHTSNSQYGAWFGPGSPGGTTNIPLSRGSTPGSSAGKGAPRTLGNIPTITDKYSTMNTNNVTQIMGHTPPDPMEKFSSLANKFGTGRILTPISSQYDRIMQEEEDLTPSKRHSKTPIHSPELDSNSNQLQSGVSFDMHRLSPRENGYRKTLYKDESGQRNTFENSFDSRNSSVGNIRPGFERAQSFTPQASYQPTSPVTNGISSKYDNVDSSQPGYLQRANTFTNGDLTSSRFSTSPNTKPVYQWKHDPHPPSSSSTETTKLNGSYALYDSAKDAVATNGYDKGLSEEIRQVDKTVDSAGSQRSSHSLESSFSGSNQSSLNGLDTSQGSNSMYWLYGSRGKPPPTPYRPNSYMYKMENGGSLSDQMKFSPSPPSNSSQYRSPSDLNLRSYSGAGTGSGVTPEISVQDYSPVNSPRGRLQALQNNHSFVDPVTQDPDYDNLRPSLSELSYGGYTPSALSNGLDNNRLVSSNALSGNSYDTAPSSPTKSILKKTSSYNSIRGVDFPLFSDTSTGRYADMASLGKPLPPLSRAASNGPVPVRKTPSGSGKRVTFILTPRTKEISPREDRSTSMMNMFNNFRFDSSLLEYSET